MFKEAYQAELERGGLLQNQLQTALMEKLGLEGDGGGMKISVQAPEVRSPGQTGGTWREAYESAKQRTDSLEKQLQKARGMGATQAPPPAATPPPAAPAAEPAAASSSTSDSSDGLREALRGVGAGDQLQQVQELQKVSDMALEEETVLRLISVSVLPAVDRDEDPGRLPAMNSVLEAIGSEDYSVSETVAFDRCYVFKGSMPQGRNSEQALEAMQRRLPGNVELFLQPAKDEGKTMLLLLLKGDLPKQELETWQWGLFGVLFLVTLFAVNSTAYSVVPMNTPMANPNDVDAVTRIAAKCLPTSAAILAVIAAQESARRAAAAKYGVELSPPFLIPAWPLPSTGCLGAVTRRLSLAPNTEAEFAMSASAGVAGLVVALGVIALGFGLGPDKDGIVNINFQLLPALLKATLKPLLGVASVTNQADPFADPTNLAYPANPVLVGGIIGLITTALSLLPIGRLDGGVLARSALGSQVAGPLGIVGFLVLLVGSFASNDEGSLYLSYGILALLWQNGAELPPREAITGLDDGQKALGSALLAVAFLVCIPGGLFPTM